MKAAPPVKEVTISQNWSGLSLGQQVTVTDIVGAPYRAVIEAMTEDKGVIWVIADPTHERRAFDYREGVVITPA